METILFDYSGLILVFLYYAIIAGRPLVRYIKNLKSYQLVKQRSLKELLSRARLAATMCTCAFLFLSVFDLYFDLPYIYENVVSGGFSALFMLLFSILYEIYFETEGT